MVFKPTHPTATMHTSLGHPLIAPSIPPNAESHNITRVTAALLDVAVSRDILCELKWRHTCTIHMYTTPHYTTPHYTTPRRTTPHHTTAHTSHTTGHHTTAQRTCTHSFSRRAMPSGPIYIYIYVVLHQHVYVGGLVVRFDTLSLWHSPTFTEVLQQDRQHHSPWKGDTADTSSTWAHTTPCEQCSNRNTIKR